MWGGELSLYADFKNIQYLKGSVVNMYIYKDLVNDIWYYTTIRTSKNYTIYILLIYIYINQQNIYRIVLRGSHSSIVPNFIN